MKRLNIYAAIMATMSIMATSCSNDDALVVKSIDEFVAQKQVPVTFGTYKGGAATTRAGSPGAINTTAQLRTKGFGVFAFNTEETTFDNVNVTTRSLIPDFMYNEYIVWHDDTVDPTKSAWEYYDPNNTKYWPNDFNNGAVDNRGANAATGSKKYYISFFAYAPYAGTLTQNTPTSHNGATSSANEGTNSGIIAVSGNNHNGDPIITYKLADDTQKVVDLLWGTAGGAQNGDDVTGNPQPGGPVSRSLVDGVATSPITPEGDTNIDMTKQKTGGKIMFNFKHALSKMGGSTVGAADPTYPKSGLTVDLIIDDVTGPTNVKANTTIVTVKSISIKNYTVNATSGVKTMETPLMSNKGEFNLATGIWNLFPASISDATSYVTIDHQVDQTGTQGNTLNPAIMEPTSAVTAWTDLTMAGVEETPKNVYKDEASPLLFLPGTTPKFNVTVEYVVRTQDTKLAKGYTEVTQKITKNVAFTTPLEQNKQYNLAMHIGLTTIKFDATVCDWDTETTSGGSGSGSGSGSGTTPVVHPVDLPINVN